MSVELQMQAGVRFLLIFFTLTLLGACGPTDSSCPEYISITEEDGGFYVEINTPAGQRSGEEDFLPAPFNIGVVNTGTENMRVLLLRDALARGSKVAFEPIGAMMLDSSGTRETIIVGVPTDLALRTMKVGSLEDLLTEYEAVRNMTQAWIVNHKGFGAFELIGWQDEKYVRSILESTQ